MRRAKNIHFIGIGGSGMNGIAEVLLNQGYTITGSDQANNSVIARLRAAGALIFSTHDPKNVVNADVVVISSAIGEDNPELLVAREKRIPVLPRAQMLAELMRFHYGIAIAGTHGKTTTTSLVASILAEGELDPTFVIGGLLNSAGSNARLGKSRYFIVEADESDASFLYFNPVISVITNIDVDHMQTYENDFNKLKRTFIDFVHRLPFYGSLIACVDDPNVREIIPQIARSVITYGFSAEADVQGLEYVQDGWCAHFKVRRKCFADQRTGESLLDVNLNLPGKHNALNALAAIAVATELNVGDEAIRTALSKFSGVGRRLQIHGVLHFPCGNAVLIDDYGHHPEEIRVTLQALRSVWPQRRLVLAFQPHRYTRTKSLFDDFAAVLSEVDLLLLLDIYSAGEESIVGISGQALAHSIRQRGKVDPVFISDIAMLPGIIANVIGDNDVLLLQGAGSIGTMSSCLLDKYGTP